MYQGKGVCKGWAHDIAALILGHDAILGLGRYPLHRLPMPVQLGLGGGRRFGRAWLEGIFLIVLEQLRIPEFEIHHLVTRRMMTLLHVFKA